MANELTNKVVYSINFGYKVDAKQAYRHLKKLSRENDGFTSDDVVESAKDKDSPIHHVFEWNDKKAATKWRRFQAKQLVASIKVTARSSDTEQTYINAFVADQKEGHRVIYRPSVEVMNLSASNRFVLKRAVHELQSWMKRYQSVPELKVYFELLENKKMAKLIEEIEQNGATKLEESTKAKSKRTTG